MAATRHASLTEIIKFALWLVVICVSLIASDLFWRWDQLVYDAQQRLFTRSPPDDVIIVAIDEASLKELGRWPWRRDTHAHLISRLSREGARVIAMDIIFAEPDWRHPEDDKALKKAVAESGRVILPVLVEQGRLGSVLRETLPLTELVEKSAGLGHVHVELDPDGIARSLFLREGLGAPHWPALSVTTLRFIQPDSLKTLPGARRVNESDEAGQQTWVRDYHVKIPFYGPPGHFAAISYAQVLKGDYSPRLFNNQVVFVGLPATGLGDALPTPVSGLSRAMPGVEINATAFAGLRQNIMINDLSAGWRYVLSIVLALLPVLFLPRVRPRLAWLSAVFVITLTILISALLLRIYNLWFAPVAVLLTVVLSYPIWGWRRLEFTMRYMDNEIAQLNRQRGIPVGDFDVNADIALEYISKWMPLRGLVFYQEDGQKLYAWGDEPAFSRFQPAVDRWTEYAEDCYWFRQGQEYGSNLIGVRWLHPQLPDKRQTSILNRLLLKIRPVPPQRPQNTYEVIQARTQMVHEATRQLTNLKLFIETTLDQMADSVLVVNSFGQVILCNRQARIMFADGGELTGQWIMPILKTVHLTENHRWTEVFRAFYESSEPIQVQARMADKYDLLVNVSPMYMGEDYKYDAVVVNVSNITSLVESERRRKEALSFLSHDIRSPLSSILGLTELMALPGKEKELAANLDRITNYAWRTIQLAEEFVQIARMEGNEQVEFTEINLVEIAANALDQVWDQAQARSITLRRDYVETQLDYIGNPQLLERAFMNLLSNAIKYSKPSTTVTLHISKDDEKIICRVSDQGFGIPKEDIPYIMDRFRRVEKSQHASMQGLGLGLAFVKVVLERHGGTIHIDSKMDVGTSIELRLPITPINPDDSNIRLASKLS